MRTNKARRTTSHTLENCCSTVEQQRLNEEVLAVPNSSENKKWTVSQVERLTTLPRRYIQRCCYAGKGGVGILTPAESEWGHRYYEAKDIALLYLVAQLRRQGKTLPEVKEILDAKQAAGQGLSEMLEGEAVRLGEQIEELEAQLTRAKALSAALSENAEEELDELIVTSAARADADTKGITARTNTGIGGYAVCADGAARADTNVGNAQIDANVDATQTDSTTQADATAQAGTDFKAITEQREALAKLAALPGLDLALELRFGSGFSE